GLTALEILVPVDASVLALGDLAADRAAVIDLGTIGAKIEPALVRILGDDAVGSADEARLVKLMMPRHREFEHIDGIALDHILENRSVLDVARRQRPEIAHTLVIALHNVHLAVVLQRQSERKRNAADGRELAVERAVAPLITRDFVE